MMQQKKSVLIAIVLALGVFLFALMIYFPLVLQTPAPTPTPTKNLGKPIIIQEAAQFAAETATIVQQIQETTIASKLTTDLELTVLSDSQTATALYFATELASNGTTVSVEKTNLGQNVLPPATMTVGTIFPTDTVSPDETPTLQPTTTNTALSTRTATSPKPSPISTIVQTETPALPLISTHTTVPFSTATSTPPLSISSSQSLTTSNQVTTNPSIAISPLSRQGLTTNESLNPQVMAAIIGSISALIVAGITSVFTFVSNRSRDRTTSQYQREIEELKSSLERVRGQELTAVEAKFSRELELFKRSLELKDEELKRSLNALHEANKAIQKMKDEIQRILDAVQGSIDPDDTIIQCEAVKQEIVQTYREFSTFLNDHEDEVFHKAKNMAIVTLQHLQINKEEITSIDIKNELVNRKAALTERQQQLRDSRMDRLMQKVFPDEFTEQE